MPSSVSSSVHSIFTSLSFIESLPFSCTPRLSAAALAPREEWDGHHIRDAEEHERALFTANVDEAADGDGGGPLSNAGGRDDGERMHRLRRSILGRGTASSRSAAAGAWQLTKRRGPLRVKGPETATPLKKRRNSYTGEHDSSGDMDPEVYLAAARKLLEH